MSSSSNPLPFSIAIEENLNQTTGFFSLTENGTQRIPFNIYEPLFPTPLLYSIEIKEMVDLQT